MNRYVQCFSLTVSFAVLLVHQSFATDLMPWEIEEAPSKETKNDTSDRSRTTKDESDTPDVKTDPMPWEQARKPSQEVDPLADLRRLAESGDIKAQYELGTKYGLGKSAAKNPEEAFRWFKISAEGGYAPAQNDVGYCYNNGFGVEKNLANAFKWYKRAAEGGYVTAVSNLGLCYEKGYGTQKDLQKALAHYKTAAGKGSAHGLFRLAQCHEKGIGTDIDLQTALELYKKAVEAGNKDAKSGLERVSAKINQKTETNKVQQKESPSFEKKVDAVVDFLDAVL